MSEKQTLRDIDFGDRVKDKNGLSYISWADVWDVIIDYDADAEYEIHHFPDPACEREHLIPYQKFDKGGMVWVSVTIKGKTRKAYLPIMNYKNQAVVEPNSTEVNNAIQRCFAKAAAMHGLGLYVYRGEDLPPEQAKEPKKPEVDQTELTVHRAMILGAESLDELKQAWAEIPPEYRANLTAEKDQSKAGLMDVHA